MNIPTLKYQSQAVAKLYFIAAIGLFVGQIVHAGTGSEIIDALGTAVQHHHQGQGPAGGAGFHP